MHHKDHYKKFVKLQDLDLSKFGYLQNVVFYLYGLLAYKMLYIFEAAFLQP